MARSALKTGNSRVAVSNGPRLIVTDGERIDQTVADTTPGLTVDQIVVDRDVLRGLRNSLMAVEIADKALGDGALAAIMSRKGGEKRIIMVNPYDLHFEDGHNPRDFTSVEMRERVLEIAQSINARSVRKALDVYKKGSKLYINGGETRWRAVMHVINFMGKPIDGVPVVISSGENATDRLIDSYNDNNQLQFKPIEAGKLFRDILDLGETAATIAVRIGKGSDARGIAFVMNRIKLLEMPNWLQDQVRSGAIVADAAYKDIWLASGEDDTKAKRLLEGAVDAASDAGSVRDGAVRVMPKHIRKAGGGSMTKAEMSRMLADILGNYDRADLEGLFSTNHVETLFKMAGM